MIPLQKKIANRDLMLHGFDQWMTLAPIDREDIPRNWKV